VESQLRFGRALRMLPSANLRMVVVFLTLLAPAISRSQDVATVAGKTQDCFAGKLIHPSQVDIYLLAPAKSHEIMTILNDLEKQKPKGNDAPTDAFFAAYKRLTAAIKDANVSGHVRSDTAGDFSFQSLRVGEQVLLLGISEREDEPAYYSYTPLNLQPGRNSLILDFDQRNACIPH